MPDRYFEVRTPLPGGCPDLVLCRCLTVEAVAATVATLCRCERVRELRVVPCDPLRGDPPLCEDGMPPPF